LWPKHGANLGTLLRTPRWPAGRSAAHGDGAR